MGVEGENFALFGNISFGEGANHGVYGLLDLCAGGQTAASKQVVGLRGCLKEVGIEPCEKVFDGGKPIEYAHSVSR